MPARSVVRWTVFAVGAYLLFFHGMGLRGLVGPDEPRYASIARAMAESGDWVTPRLDGEPWFEKPALLYWLGAVGIKLGVRADEATRLASAFAAVLFLVYYRRRLRTAFGDFAGDAATALLATAGGWAAFAQAGVFDALLTASFGAAMLSLLDWIENPERKERLPLFGALLGLAVLAKGLVGPALATLSLIGVCRERGLAATARDLFHPRATGPFLLVTVPWYLACYLANGTVFLEEFLWRHHIQRIFSSELQHVQPWWFYLPVLLGALLPWTPLLASLRRRDWARDARASFLMAWAVSTIVFFSISTNKLPGYILPALPAICALLGVRLARGPVPRIALPLCAVLLGVLPLAAQLLPRALADGLGDAWPPSDFPAAAGAAVAAAAALTAYLSWRGRAGWALAMVTAAAVWGVADLKRQVYPALDRAAGVRALWRDVQPSASSACIGDVRRHVRYGLAFYGRGALPSCDVQPRPLRIEGDPPRVER